MKPERIDQPRCYCGAQLQIVRGGEHERTTPMPLLRCTQCGTTFKLVEVRQK